MTEWSSETRAAFKYDGTNRAICVLSVRVCEGERSCSMADSLVDIPLHKLTTVRGTESVGQVKISTYIKVWDNAMKKCSISEI